MAAVALEELERGLRTIADAIKELRAADEWIDQHSSPLGRRAHVEACRDGRLPAHKPEGTRRWLVRRSDLDAFITRKREAPKPTEDERADVTSVLNFKAPQRRRRAG